jgi:hypothetical protein
MDPESYKERSEDLLRQMQDIALEGIALGARTLIADFEEELGHPLNALDFFTGFVAGQIAAKDAPEEAVIGVTKELIEKIGPSITLPDPETAFDDLPVIGGNQKEDADV